MAPKVAILPGNLGYTLDGCIESNFCHSTGHVRGELTRQSSSRADAAKDGLLHYELTGDRAGDTADLLGGYSSRYVLASLESSRESQRAVQWQNIHTSTGRAVTAAQRAH